MGARKGSRAQFKLVFFLRPLYDFQELLFFHNKMCLMKFKLNIFIFVLRHLVRLRRSIKLKINSINKPMLQIEDNKRTVI